VHIVAKSYTAKECDATKMMLAILPGNKSYLLICTFGIRSKQVGKKFCASKKTLHFLV